MARSRSAATPTSLYRIRPIDGKTLEHYVKDKYVTDMFALEHLEIEGQPALFVHGVVPNDLPKWAIHASSLTGLAVPVRNLTSAGLLLVPFREYIYVLSWGMGHLLVDQGFLDPSFGLRFVLRRANPREVRSITTQAMETIPRTARTSIFGGASLDAFGMEEVGELLSRLVVPVPADGLTASVGKDFYKVTAKGTDALNVPLARSPSALMQDLEFIHNVVENESPVAGLEHVENTRALRANDPVLVKLDDELSKAMASQGSLLALCWPAEWEEEYGEVAAYVISGLVQRRVQVDDLQLCNLTDVLRDVEPERRVARLRSARIQALNSGGEVVSPAIPADRWITFQVDLDGQRYIYHRGKWYNVGGAYLEMLRNRVSAILAARSRISLPAWPREVKKSARDQEYRSYPIGEGKYNLLAAKSDPKLVCLDRKLLHTSQHPRGIEACDLLYHDGTLIHVKRLDDSIAASHLFNQALVSAEALRRQPDALERLRERVVEAGGDPDQIDPSYRLKKVVLAFAGKPVGIDELFTFSQVTLYRLAQRLGDWDIGLEFVEIQDEGQ